MFDHLLDLSFGVKRPDGYVSDIWRVSISQLGDFRLATSSIAGAEEYSFGNSGICRSAHSGAEGAPDADAGSRRGALARYDLTAAHGAELERGAARHRGEEGDLE